MIRDNQFNERIWSDPHRHVADFLEISNLFQYGENQEEAVMLRNFPFSLSGEAKTCFHQLDHKTLVEAWIRIKEMLRTCYGHGLTKGTIIQIFYRGLDDPTQGILDAGGIFLYNTPNEAFKILEDKVLLKLDFSDDSQNNPKPKTVVFAGGSDIDSYHQKEMRDGRKDNHASQIYMKDDTPMCDPHEANYYLVKILQTESLPRTIDSKTRHEFVYKPPSIRNENDKGDVAAIEEDAIKPIPTMLNSSLIKYNLPFLKDFAMHIPYTNANTIADDVL
ncbi:hypothetical protein Tco_0273679 [Tanacetum coccineum]